MRIDRDTHRQTFFLYGLLIGLAISQACISVIPSILSDLPDFWASPDLTSVLRASRLFVFLFVAVRFYLGAIHYYDQHLRTSEGGEPITGPEYLLEFVTGVVHFLLVVIWSQTILLTNTAFLVTLTLVLLFDWTYKLTGAKRSGYAALQMKLWRWMNLITVAMMWGAYQLAAQWSPSNEVRELAALSIVVVASGLDLDDLISSPGDGALSRVANQWAGYWSRIASAVDRKTHHGEGKTHDHRE